MSRLNDSLHLAGLFITHYWSPETDLLHVHFKSAGNITKLSFGLFFVFKFHCQELSPSDRSEYEQKKTISKKIGLNLLLMQ